MATTLSQSITNLDASPLVRNTAGEGGQGSVLNTSDSLAIATSAAVGDLYKFVRIPTNAHVKNVKLWSAVATAGAADFDVMFSDSTTDGTTSGNQGTIPQISAADNKLFGAAQSLVGQAGVQLLYANTTNFPHGSANSPLWSVLGYTSDPGGFFDIVAKITTIVTTGGAAELLVEYVIPGAS